MTRQRLILVRRPAPAPLWKPPTLQDWFVALALVVLAGWLLAHSCGAL